MREQDLQASVNGVFVLEKIPNYGIIKAASTFANRPIGVPGYAPGCRLFLLDGVTTELSAWMYNSGTLASCTFSAATT